MERIPAVDVARALGLWFFGSFGDVHRPATGVTRSLASLERDRVTLWDEFRCGEVSPLGA